MNRPTSYKLHIRQMFSEIDLASMEGRIDLTSYDEVRDLSEDILDRLKDEDDPMPPEEDGGPWPDEWISLFERWIAEDHPP